MQGHAQAVVRLELVGLAVEVAPEAMPDPKLDQVSRGTRAVALLGLVGPEADAKAGVLERGGTLDRKVMLSVGIGFVPGHYHNRRFWTALVGAARLESR